MTLKVGLLVLALLVTVDGELFASPWKLQEFLGNLENISSNLNSYIAAEKRRLDTIVRLSDELETLGNFKSNEQGESYSEHDMDIYSVVWQWVQIDRTVAFQDNVRRFKMKMKDMLVPTEADLDAVAKSIVRMKQMYRISLKDLTAGVILGRQGAPPNDNAIYELGRAALATHDFNLAVQLFTQVKVKMLLHSNLKGYCLDLASAIEKYNNDLDRVEKMLKLATKLDPWNATIHVRYWSVREKLETWTKEQIQVTPPAVDPLISNGKYNLQFQEDYRALCRGDPHTKPSRPHKLRCRYRKTKIPYEVYKVEILNISPRIVVIYDVMTEQEAENIQKNTIHRMQSSRTFSGSNDYRVSQTQFMDLRNSGMGKLLDRIKRITGLDAEYTLNGPPSAAEPMQVVRYGVGGYYLAHNDDGKDQNAFNDTGGRMATFLVYLNEVTAGGRTVFPLVNVSVPVVKRAAAFWYNFKRSGEVDENSLHAGCPVLLGSKWVGNVWIHQDAQMFRRPCGLTEHALDYK